MSIQWMDNFSQYGTSTGNMTNGLYALVSGASLVNDPDGVSTGKVFSNSSGNYGARRILSGTRTTVGLGFRMWMPNLPNSGNPAFCSFNDAGNGEQITICCTSTGIIQARRGSVSGTLLASSAGPVLVANAWNHIETKCFFNGTTGTVDVRVNGIPALTFTGNTVNTANVECSQVIVGSAFNPVLSCYYKDLICWDGLGSVNNTFMGDIIVATMFPDADVTLTWTPSTGTTGFNLLAKTTPNDTTYLQAGSPPPAASLFSLSDLPSDIVSVKGLQTYVRAVKSDGGTATMQVGIKSGATVGNGTDRPVTIANTYWFDTFEVDPNTGTAWTPVTANAAQLQLNRTS